MSVGGPTFLTNDFLKYSDANEGMKITIESKNDGELNDSNSKSNAIGYFDEFDDYEEADYNLGHDGVSDSIN